MATTSVPITAGTGTPIRVVTNTGVDSGADQQIVTLADSAGNLLGTAAAPIPIVDLDVSTTGTITATDAAVGAPAGAGVPLTGTPTANSTVAWALGGGDATIDLQLTGTFGGGTVYFEASADGGTYWVPLHMKQVGILQTTIAFGVTAAGVWRTAAAGWSNVRVRIIGATTPSVAVVMRASGSQALTILGASLPGGTNAIGQLTPSTLVVTASAAATAGTATLPAAGAGLFHYITNIRVERTTTAATTGAASSFVTGGTNHALVFQLPSDTQAIGYQSTPVDYRPTTPLRVLAANTATTITTPAVTATTYRITVTYYTAA